MSTSVIIGVTVFIVLVGGIIAVLWWRLAARMAPYRDELRRNKAGSGGTGARDEQVVVIDERGSGGGGGPNGTGR